MAISDLEIWFDKFVKPDRRAYLRIGFGNFVGPDFPFHQKRQWSIGREEGLTLLTNLPMEERTFGNAAGVHFYSCLHNTDSCLFGTLAEKFRLQAASGSGACPCKRVLSSKRYACYNQKRTRYGVVSITREILPELELELEFERDMNFSRSTPPRFLGRQPQFKGFGPAFWESIGHVPVTIGHSGPPHA